MPTGTEVVWQAWLRVCKTKLTIPCTWYGGGVGLAGACWAFDVGHALWCNGATVGRSAPESSLEPFALASSYALVYPHAKLVKRQAKTVHNVM